jgi:hypothetical protein
MGAALPASPADTVLPGMPLNAQRTFDAARVNALVNDPVVRPGLGGDTSCPLDLTAAVSDRGNVFLVGAHGGVCFCWSAPATYELHAFVQPDGRGAWATDLLFDGLRLMKAEHGADTVWCRVAPSHRHIRILALHLGFAPAGENTIDLGVGPITYQLFVWKA